MNTIKSSQYGEGGLPLYITIKTHVNYIFVVVNVNHTRLKIAQAKNGKHMHIVYKKVQVIIIHVLHDARNAQHSSSQELLGWGQVILPSDFFILKDSLLVLGRYNVQQD